MHSFLSCFVSLPSKNNIANIIKIAIQINHCFEIYDIIQMRMKLTISFKIYQNQIYSEFNICCKYNLNLIVYLYTYIIYIYIYVYFGNKHCIYI